MNSKNSGRQATVYVSGLKPTVRLEELAELFGSIGLIKQDKRNRTPKIRIYTDDAGVPKGDAVVTYEDAHTAPAAIEWFDGKDFQVEHLLYL